MFLKISVLLFATLILGIACHPSRTGRQVAQTTSAPPSTTTGTTTTTASPAYTKCIRRCPVTQQYDPVCGTDGIVYFNRGRVTCAVNCGNNVRVAYVGTC